MPFHIALNMAGAVSAGAYTAGVLDFLVEALDEWYAEKDRQRALHGDDITLWTIPAHDVVLDVMSGASAGGMCSAIGAIALQEEFDHIRTGNPGPEVPRNRLYKSWVETIDMMPLLGTDDLPGGQGPVKSLLDSSVIQAIAQSALKPDPTRAQKREWVAERLGIILTLTNLRGIPYSVDLANAGSFEEGMAYHADRIAFSVAAGGAVDTTGSYALNYSDAGSPNWQILASAAMATGAFPVMLAARTLERKPIEYESRSWTITNVAPDAAGMCQSETKITPAWGAAAMPQTFQNAYADGGMTNNNPFECARQYLLAAAGNTGHNPRNSEDANAAVISVAPFPGNESFQRDYNADEQTQLGNVLTALIGTLVNQSRFQGEELVLTKDETVFSRFAIAPSADGAGSDPALLCAALGAFGGFVDRKFRDHDYQLGRRNCQKFLTDHFILPANNVTIAAGVTKTPDALTALQRDYGSQQGDQFWYPLIPLMATMKAEVPSPTSADYFTTDQRLQQVAQAATDRVKAVLHAFANSPGMANGGWSFLISAIFDLGGASKIKELILDKLRTELRGQTAQ